MKYPTIISLSLVILLSLLTASVSAQAENEERQLIDEVVADLKENILPFWVNHSPDPSGGFYGTILNDRTPQPSASKGGVLNARILWTFSTACRLFNDPGYRELADRAQMYFISYFIDTEYGGSYWSVNVDGSPGNIEKQTYGIAYGIYSMAEHYRATGNEESIRQAIALYNTLETYAFDPVFGGYIESFTRDWKKPQHYGYDGKGVAPKTMNTHLHVLEAYTTLYRVWKDPDLKKQLESIIELFLDKIIDPQRWHQRLFLTRDWQDLERIDSYGHDMELSWLLWEAAEVLGDEDIFKQLLPIVLKLVDTQMDEGWTEAGALLYERDDGEVKGGLEWWPQAESVVALYNAWQLTQDKKYLDAAIKVWDWIKANMIDHEHGEWFSGVNEDGTPQRDRPKADMWKCPYHNSRMGFELFMRQKQ